MGRLKWKLDRKSLVIINTTFIGPLLEYSDVIWDNCTRYVKQELDKTQNEAARIATGATKLISFENLQDEVKWQPLQKGRDNHKRTLFYKMNNNLTPSYLSALVLGTVSSATRYNLRNSNDIMTIQGRTNSYLSSFLPSTVKDWYNLPPEIAQSDSVASFKYMYTLNRDGTHVPKYFYSGNRHVQVLHTSLRTQCSALNHDLVTKNISDTPLCRFGSVENTHHIFFKCPFYNIVKMNFYMKCQLYMKFL